jgi:hypothetical protein
MEATIETTDFADFLISRKVKPFTHQLAKWYLALNSLPGERPIGDEHVEKLFGELDRGSFLGELSVIATGKVGNTIYQLNGRHTCTAMLKYNGKRSYEITHLQYELPTLEKAGELYAKFDPNWAGRTFPHILRAWLRTHGFGEDYGMRLMTLFCSAATFDFVGKNPFGMKKVIGLDKVELIKKYPTILRAVLEIIGDNQKSSAHLRKLPVMCAIFQTVKKSERAAKMFWIAVRDGENLSKQEPAKKLETYLRENTFNRGMAAVCPKRKAGFREMYAKCIHAWNAYRNGSTTDMKFYPNAKLPEAD